MVGFGIISPGPLFADLGIDEFILSWRYTLRCYVAFPLIGLNLQFAMVIRKSETIKRVHLIDLIFVAKLHAVFFVWKSAINITVFYWDNGGRLYSLDKFVDELVLVVYLGIINNFAYQVFLVLCYFFFIGR